MIFMQYLRMMAIVCLCLTVFTGQALSDDAKKAFTIVPVEAEAGMPESPKNISLRLVPSDVVLSYHDLNAVVAKDLAVYVLPKGKAYHSAGAEKYRCKGLFVKAFKNQLYLDIRRTPKQLKAGKYGLTVLWRIGKRNFTQSISEAITYSSQLTDVVLVVDASYSMRNTDPRRLRVAAAKGFVDLAGRSGRIANIGVVRFKGRADILSPLTSVVYPKVLYGALDRLDASGRTDIDAALRMAKRVLATSKSQRQAIVLMTDGKNEPPPYRDTHQVFAANDVPVYTIGLSREADKVVLKQIASDTGGQFFIAPTEKELFGIYQRIGISIQQRPRLHDRGYELLGDQMREVKIPIDKTVKLVEWMCSAPHENFQFSLTMPEGLKVSSKMPSPPGNMGWVQSPRSMLYKWRRPPPGQWSYRVESLDAKTTVTRSARSSQRESDFTGEKGFSIRVLGETPLYLKGFEFINEMRLGEPMDIACSLANGSQPVGGGSLTIKAIIVAPDRKTAPQTIELYDDGKHNDGAANDGLFCHSYDGHAAPGEYKVIYQASYDAKTGPWRKSIGAFVRTTESHYRVNKQSYVGVSVQPKLLDFGLVQRGETHRQQLNFKIHKRKQLAVTFSIQGLSSKIATVVPITTKQLLENTTVAIGITINKRAPVGHYKAMLVVKSELHEQRIPLRFEVYKPSLFFDESPYDLGMVGRDTRFPVVINVFMKPRLKGEREFKVTYDQWRLKNKKLVPGLMIDGPSTIKLVDGVGTLSLVIISPKDLPEGDYNQKVTFKGLGIKHVLKIKGRAFVGGISTEPTVLDLGTVYRLPSKLSGKLAIHVTAFDKEALRASCVDSSAAGQGKADHWLKPAQVQLRALKTVETTGDKPSYLSYSIALPWRIGVGLHQTIIKVQTQNAEHEFPIRFFVAPLSERETVALADEQPKSIGIHVQEVKHAEFVVKSLLNKSQALEVSSVLTEKIEGLSVATVLPLATLGGGKTMAIKVKISTSADVKLGRHDLRLKLKGAGRTILVPISIDVAATPVIAFEDPPKHWPFPPALIRAAFFVLLALLIFVAFVRWFRRQKDTNMQKFVAVSLAVHVVCIYLIFVAVRDVKNISTAEMAAPMAVKMVQLKKMLGANLNQEERQLLKRDKAKTKVFKTEKKKIKIDALKITKQNSRRAQVVIKRRVALTPQPKAIKEVHISRKSPSEAPRRRMIPEKKMEIKVERVPVLTPTLKPVMPEKVQLTVKTMTTQRQDALRKPLKTPLNKHRLKSTNNPVSSRVSVDKLIKRRHVIDVVAHPVSTALRQPSIKRKRTKSKTRRFLLPDKVKQRDVLRIAVEKMTVDRPSHKKGLDHLLPVKSIEGQYKTSLSDKALPHATHKIRKKLQRHVAVGAVALSPVLRRQPLNAPKKHKLIDLPRHQDHGVSERLRTILKLKQETTLLSRAMLDVDSVKAYEIIVLARHNDLSKISVGHKNLVTALRYKSNLTKITHQARNRRDDLRRPKGSRQKRRSREARETLRLQILHMRLSQAGDIELLPPSLIDLDHRLAPEVQGQRIKRKGADELALPKSVDKGKQTLKSNVKRPDVEAGWDPNWMQKDKRHQFSDKPGLVSLKGKVKWVRGNAYAVRAGKRLNLVKGMVIEPFDVVGVGDIGVAGIELSKYTSIKLDAQSEVKIMGIYPPQVGYRVHVGLHIVKGIVSVNCDSEQIRHLIQLPRHGGQLDVRSCRCLIDATSPRRLSIFVAAGAPLYLSASKPKRLQAQHRLDIPTNGQIKYGPFNAYDKALYRKQGFKRQ